MEITEEMREKQREKTRKINVLRYKRRYHSIPDFRRSELKKGKDKYKYGYISKLLESITGNKYEIHHLEGVLNSDVIVFMPKDKHRKSHKH